MKELSNDIIVLIKQHANALYADQTSHQIYHLNLLESLVKVSQDQLKDRSSDAKVS